MNELINRWYNYHGKRKPLKMFTFHCKKQRKIELFKKIRDYKGRRHGE